jgi:hypothetical protein
MGGEVGANSAGATSGLAPYVNVCWRVCVCPMTMYIHSYAYVNVYSKNSCMSLNIIILFLQHDTYVQTYKSIPRGC